MGSNWEKCNIAIAILEKVPFLKGRKIISHFDGSNNIFADYMFFKDAGAHIEIILISRVALWHFLLLLLLRCTM